jgi:hypothetical protein
MAIETNSPAAFLIFLDLNAFENLGFAISAPNPGVSPW